MNIVITGASKGIGFAIAKKFAANGHHLFLTSKTQADLVKAVEELKQLFPASTIEGVHADLSIEGQVHCFTEWCLLHTQPDVLINNAGYFLPGKVTEEPAGTLEAQLNANLLSAYYTTKDLLPAMLKKGRGHIFNICSIASLNAYENGGS